MNSTFLDVSITCRVRDSSAVEKGEKSGERGRLHEVASFLIITSFGLDLSCYPVATQQLQLLEEQWQDWLKTCSWLAVQSIRSLSTSYCLVQLRSSQSHKIYNLHTFIIVGYHANCTITCHCHWKTIDSLILKTNK